MSDANEMQQEIFDEILAERASQDHKWGGSEHDDQHRLSDWNAFIDDANRKAKNALYEANPTDWRCLMIQVAALAVAAAESFDRRANASADFVEAMSANPNARAILEAEQRIRDRGIGN